MTPNSIRTRSKRLRVDDCSKVPRGRGRPRKEDSINNENNGSPARRPRSTRNRRALSKYSPSSPDVVATVVTDTCKGRKLPRTFWCDACSCKNGICKKPWEIQVPLHLRPGLDQGQGIHNQPAALQIHSIDTPCPFESNIPIDSAISTVQTGSARASSLPGKRLFDPSSQKRADKYVPCQGIDRGSFGCTLSFAAKAMKSTSSVLDNMSRDEKSGFGQSTFGSLEFGERDGLLPLNGMRVKKLPGSGGFLVVDVECTGMVKEGPNTKVARCPACSKDCKYKRQVIRRSQQYTSFEQFGNKARIDYIAGDTRQAEQEIRRLREENRNLRREKARTEMHDRMRLNGVTVTGECAENLVNAANMMDDEIKKAVGEDSKEREVWHVFHEHLNTCFKRGGKMKGIRVDETIKQWALVLLARTSKRIYMEVAKVLKLPHISYIYRLSNQIVSKHHSRGSSFSLSSISKTFLSAAFHNVFSLLSSHSDALLMVLVTR